MHLLIIDHCEVFSAHPIYLCLAIAGAGNGHECWSILRLLAAPFLLDVTMFLLYSYIERYNIDIHVLFNMLLALAGKPVCFYWGKLRVFFLPLKDTWKSKVLAWVWDAVTYRGHGGFRAGGLQSLSKSQIHLQVPTPRSCAYQLKDRKRHPDSKPSSYTSSINRFHRLTWY